MSLKNLIREDNKIIKTFTFDLSDKNKIKINNCDKCLITCCDNPSNTAWYIPLTEEEKLYLHRQYLVLAPKNLKISQEKALLNKMRGINHKDICEFSSSKGCTLKDKRPLHCKIFPFLFFNNEIVLSKGCLVYKNSSMGDIRKGAMIAKELFSQESTSYLEITNKINTKDRKRSLEVGQDYIFTGIFL
jgi:Fe-S-cluster containining protein